MPQAEGQASSCVCAAREGTICEEWVVADYGEREGWAMSVSRLVKRSVFGVFAVLVLAMVGGVSSASALSPWWHLTSGARPTSIQSGVAENEVQEITVSGNEGRYLLVGGGVPAFVEWNTTHEEMQEDLEGIYGKGNVTVTAGPGDETGSKPYVVTFVGGLAGQRVEPMQAVISPFVKPILGCKAGSGPGCKGEATVTEKTKGRPDGKIVVTAANLGDADANGEAVPVSVADRLPAGLRAVAIEGIAGAATAPDGPVECSLETLTCTFAHSLPPYNQLEVVISVVVESVSSGETNEVSVTGGEAKPASIVRPVLIGGEPAKFGVEDYEMTPEEDGGMPDTQAGSHPFQLTTTFTLNQTADTNPVALAKDLHFKLPPGLIGNPTPFPQCTLAQFDKRPTSGNGLNECPPQSAVGVATITINGASVLISSGADTITTPVFNLEPAVGEPARFGFSLVESPVILDTAVRTGGDYGVTVKVNNIVQTAAFIKNEVTFWGVPGDPRHDNQRGWNCLQDAHESGAGPCPASEAAHPPPLLSMPTSCSGKPLQTSVEAASWMEPGSFVTAPMSQAMPTLDGCNRLPFSPTISVAPDSQAGSTPTGLTVGIHVPQDVSLNSAGLAESQVKDTKVTLPAGVALNPAAADGLQACSEAQVALNEDVPAKCPEASKVATVEIKSPLLPEPLIGEVYLAAQNANPFGSLVALYLVAEDPIAGVLVKVAGEVKPDPVTGQLVSTFRNTPQLPFEDLRLHFFGGSRAPLSSPSLCATYMTSASITPWSGNAAAEPVSTFEVLSGPNGIGCANPLPFSPALTAGTTSIQAGGFSPFTMTMSRPDGSQNLQAIQLKMPPGLLGTLAGVKLCKEEQANLGTCGPESLIGHTTVSVGVGGNPYSVTGGEVFITEGYKGAPYGLSIVNPAKAGPFDLGKVIVRAKIEVDPITAGLTVTTDTSGPYKIPTILDGIPLQIQHVNVAIDRHDFTFNPTNCSPLAVTGSLTSDQGATESLSVPFQITNCAVLAFKPKLTAKTNGRTSRANGASLSVKLTYPAGPFDANISKVKVDLPKQLPSRLTTLQKACPAKVFEANPAACPSASIVGHAKATTPVLPVGLEGPAYFVSHGGEEFPQLIIVLQGYGTTVHLVGSTFISKAGITSSTFKQVPDVPVGTFELTLPQGKFSALAANGNLCTTKKLVMPTSFIAQNGAVIHTSTPITPTGCAKHKAKKAKKTIKHKKK
jgi:hypothetical protein